MKKIIILISLFIYFWFTLTSANSCKYEWKINECNSALKSFQYKDGSFMTPWASVKSIDSFICIQDSYEKIVLQIAMDENFKKVDEDMDKYLSSLSEQKNLYFWKDATYTYYDWINHIWKKSEYFKIKYSEACAETFVEATSCVKNEAYKNKEDQNSISVKSALEYLDTKTKDSNGDCYWLSDVKVEIFNSVAYNTLLLNKQQVLRDEKKLFEQEWRTKYNKLLDLMMINLWYMERIWQKWPSKTKNAK